MRLFVTDCEGPVSKNDNAMELAAQFVPQGERFFALVSKYDDYLAYVEKRAGYKAGDTLRLILPFLKAYGATDSLIEEYSRDHILLMPGAKETLRYIMTMMPGFMISTSYEPYIKALCAVIDFPFENAYCTKLQLDHYPLPREEQNYLRTVKEEITSMEMIEWDEGAQGLNDLLPATKRVVLRLNEIFWDEISHMKIGRIMQEVDPIGGEGKAAVLQEIVRNTGNDLTDVCYVGDSITDLQALQKVKGGGGLAVSFNGNAYAIQAAQVVCVGENTGIISVLAYLFAKGGAVSVLALLPNWGEETLRLTGVGEDLLRQLSAAEAAEVTPKNQALWTEKSQRIRREVRGVQIGSLG